MDRTSTGSVSRARPSGFHPGRVRGRSARRERSPRRRRRTDRPACRRRSDKTPRLSQRRQCAQGSRARCPTRKPVRRPRDSFILYRRRPASGSALHTRPDAASVGFDLRAAHPRPRGAMGDGAERARRRPARGRAATCWALSSASSPERACAPSCARSARASRSSRRARAASRRRGRARSRRR